MRKNLTRVTRTPITLAATITGTDTAGNFSLGIAGAGWEAGDIGIAIVTTVGTTSTGYTVTDWTKLEQGTGQGICSIFTREMNGADTDFASSGATGHSQTSIVIAWFRGALPVTAAESHIVTNGQDVAPNPPSTSTTSVVPTYGNFIVALGGGAETGVASPTMSMPSGYTEADTEDAGVVDSVSSIAYRTGVAGNQDPGAFGGTYTNVYTWGGTVVLQNDYRG